MKSDYASWTVAQDHALVRYVDTLCRTWSTTPSRLMPDELLLSDEVLASDDFHVLQGKFTKLTCRVCFFRTFLIVSSSLTSATLRKGILENARKPSRKISK